MRALSAENALNRRTLRVYDLTPERVRLDSTTANGYWRVTPDGLFQLGHSQDHRPDLPQVSCPFYKSFPSGCKTDKKGEGQDGGP